MSHGQPSKFDTLSFTRYMKNIGRAYRKQATELIFICHLFIQSQAPTLGSRATLRSVLRAVDDTLKNAAEAGTKTSEHVNEKIELAIQMLERYHIEYHPGRVGPNVRERMTRARENDQFSSTIRNRLNATFRPIEAEPTMKVEFVLHETLPDGNPTIVQQLLSKSFDLKEILWNFSRLKDPRKRLTLSQNPHFYARLPKLPEDYGSQFRIDPIEDLQHEKIGVLTDTQRAGCTSKPLRTRGPLATSGSQRMLLSLKVLTFLLFAFVFDIFSDVCGKLEGESIVGQAFKDASNLWYVEERPVHSQDWDSHSPTTAAIRIQDWREPIRRMLQTLKRGLIVDFNIRITTRPPRPGNSSYSYSPPPSPPSPPRSRFSSSYDSLVTISLPQSRPPTARPHSDTISLTESTSAFISEDTDDFDMGLPSGLTTPRSHSDTISLTESTSTFISEDTDNFEMGLPSGLTTPRPHSDTISLTESTSTFISEDTDNYEIGFPSGLTTPRPHSDTISLAESTSTFISTDSDNFQMRLTSRLTTLRPHSDTTSLTESTSSLISEDSNNFEMGLPSGLTTPVQRIVFSASDSPY